MKVKHIVLIIAVLFLAGAVYIGSRIAPGSYPYAEIYPVPSDEQTVVSAIQTFRELHPEYTVPDSVGLTEGRKDPSDHWYHLYFYYPTEKQVIYTWLRPNDTGGTDFAFIGVNEGLVLGHWKTINDDFSHSENLFQKQRFEERILSKIKLIVAQKSTAVRINR